MSERKHLFGGTRHLVLATVGLLLSAGFSLAAESPPQSASADVQRLPEAEEFFVHEFHATQLELDCSVCHVTAEEDSTVMQRPGHDQCLLCHEDDYETDLTPKFCGQCHASFPPFSDEDLLPYPLFKKKRAILFDFSHARHVDPSARIDPKTGFRADCTFCHEFEEDGIFAKFPGHTECQSCHSKPSITPNLEPASDTADCRGCHNPEEIENPGFSKQRRMIAAHVISGVYVNLKFSHVAHFRSKEKYDLNCTTCHYAIPESQSLMDLTLPKMLDCVECHDVSKDLAPEFRMSNCGTCHIDQPTGGAPASHSKTVKPAFHTESFRIHHEEQARARDAKCYVCHMNVAASVTAATQCINCHQVMRPVSHTVRWRDTIHGKYAALDRTSCATCHTADSCVRCHNQLPRSHAPLALFKAGAHADLAMLDQRACFTCHTFEDTCAACHRR